MATLMFDPETGEMRAYGRVRAAGPAAAALAARGLVQLRAGVRSAAAGWALEIAGVALLTSAAWLITPPFGLALAGLYLILASSVADRAAGNTDTSTRSKED